MNLYLGMSGGYRVLTADTKPEHAAERCARMDASRYGDDWEEYASGWSVALLGSTEREAGVLATWWNNGDYEDPTLVATGVIVKVTTSE